MITKVFHFASRLTSLALAACITITFLACNRDEDNSLSEETTPIDFEFSGYSYFYGSDNILFDYAGNILVSSDTISKSSCTLNLFQGKHKLIWINGLWPTFTWMIEMDGRNKYGVYYDPKAKTITNYYPDGNTDHIIVYCEKDLEVFPYQLPVQKIEYKHITCVLKIEVTDNAKSLTSQTEPSGRITGIPSVRSVSLENNKYRLNDITMPIDSIRRYEQVFMLCPSEGIDNIQPVAEIINKDRTTIEVNQIPKFSLRRGHVTTLRGPLISGSDSDWTVTMVPYKD